MNRVRLGLLITLVLMAAFVMMPGAAAEAGPSPSWIAEDYETPRYPVHRYSGEPDVGGSTSPASIGRTGSDSRVRGLSAPSDFGRLAVWFWRARLVMTGF